MLLNTPPQSIDRQDPKPHGPVAASIYKEGMPPNKFASLPMARKSTKSAMITRVTTPQISPRGLQKPITPTHRHTTSQTSVAANGDEGRYLSINFVDVQLIMF